MNLIKKFFQNIKRFKMVKNVMYFLSSPKPPRLLRCKRRNKEPLRERRTHYLLRKPKTSELEMTSNQRGICQDLWDGPNTSFFRDRRRSSSKELKYLHPSINSQESLTRIKVIYLWYFKGNKVLALLKKYAPETSTQKKARLLESAA